MPTVNRLAYIDICKFDADYYRAGVLVTDRYSDPEEFRCTSAVRPTKLQQILWGSRLSEHLFCHVFGKPLVESLSPAADLVITRHPFLLGLRSVARVPVILLASKPDSVSRLLPGPPPLHLCAHQRHPEDLDLAVSTISALVTMIPPMEPFQRIQAAIQDVHKDETQAKAV
ncbi:hypothetical protein [Gemmata sp. SH-PL17]|uniref:hypothetical protein n=1 Tax=Gemmata sp. SH-PL17 TaxID=1630693 RepID=UPI0004AFB3A3|nr:hypothetical protein [Gemmata sp. SH-PL17]